MNYFPIADLQLLAWVKNFKQLAGDSDRLDRWNIKSFPPTLFNLIAEFEAALERCALPTHNATDVKEKNVLKAQLMKGIRSFVQGFLARNDNVTEMDRVNLRLPQRDTIPTNVPPPVTQVVGVVAFTGLGLVEMRNIGPATDKPDARAGYGVRIYYGIMGGATAEENNKFRLTARPTHGSELPHSVFTRRKRHLFDFTAERGKEVFFCMRYENSKGEAGPWGKIFQAFVP